MDKKLSADEIKCNKCGRVFPSILDKACHNCPPKKLSADEWASNYYAEYGEGCAYITTYERDLPSYDHLKEFAAEYKRRLREEWEAEYDKAILGIIEDTKKEWDSCDNPLDQNLYFWIYRNIKEYVG